MTIVDTIRATKTATPADVWEVKSTSAQPGWRVRYPPRPVETDWPATFCDRDELDRLVGPAAQGLPSTHVREARRRGLPLLLDWLADQPGDTWQQRWMASGADAAGTDWAQSPEEWLRRRGNYSENRLELMTSSLLVVVGADVVRPSLAWLLTGGKKRKLVRNMVHGRDSTGFERLRHLCEKDPAIGHYPLGDILFRCAVIVAAKGGMLADITVGDVLEILDAERAVRGRADSGSATFRMLREAGVLGADTPTLQQIRSLGQRSPAQLVDRYPIECRPIRDLLVAYLAERQPAIDYTTLVTLAYHLVRCFWFDTENRSLGARFVAQLLDEALAHTGLTDPADEPLHFTPHDFRRMFITDAILNGLPPHIAQVIAGHRDIGVTMGYKAVYPDEAITAHLAFIARRRKLRPTEEYRQPTDEEWQQFLGHFERRKVSVGTCGRAFSIPCIHEHACVRCSLLWPDPNQRARLTEIRDNLTARIAEAHREGWLGEVEGLQVSLAGAEDKLAQIERRLNTTSEIPTDLGIPTLPN
jgi:hypothetical protein